MKIAFAQLNHIIGDFAGNAEKILAAYRDGVASGADLVVAPELAIPGYPPRDLLFRSRFVRRNLEVLAEIAAEVGEVPLALGYADVNDKGSGPPLRNAAAVLLRGAVAAKVWKSLLPTYDVFDEARYFEPAESVSVVEVAGRKLGVTICEDIWTEDYLPAKLYVKDPVGDLVAQGAEVIVNLSASPFHAGKPAERARMLGAVARKHGIPIAYCNAVAGNDQLVFDGYSLALGKGGGVLAQLPGFAECVAVADLASEAEAAHQPAAREADLFGALVLGVRDYVRKCGFKTVLIGLSGGIDSALTAAVAAEAVGPENVLGVSMPSVYSSEGSKDDARVLAENLGVRYESVPIQGIFEQAKSELGGIFAGMEEGLTEENMQARIRGLILMSISNKLGHLLLTTGNKSELAVGYCTIYGDMCGGLAVISDLPKTSVYAVSRWINREREVIPWSSITKPPSAELRPDQKDEDSLPPYETLDAILELLVEKSLAAPDVIEQGFDEETVRWVQRQIDISEWKRQQAAPGIRVTTKAFGSGRRIPIAQRFRV